MGVSLLILVTAYVLGSIPFGYLLVRIFRKQDIRASGSGNIGATNVARSGAKGLGIATLALDLLKGYAAVWIALRLGSYELASLAAVAAILGHMYPVWLGFRGGKGVATGLGVFLALAPLASVCALGVFVVVVMLTRYVSLASMLAAIAMPLFGLPWMAARTRLVVGCFVLIPLLILLKHHSNIRRLRAGTESRFGSSAKPGEVTV